MRTATLLAELDVYRPIDEADAAVCARIRRFVADEPRWFDRALHVGHVTGSAWVVDPRARTVALVRHRKLARWLQPGGHVEPGDADVRATAHREACEELTLALPAPVVGIYDVDVHEIPARDDEPAHLHYDLRYLIEASGETTAMPSAESHDARFVPLASLAEYSIDASVRRLAAKTPP